MVHDEEKWGIQFNHLFEDIFNSLINSNLQIVGVWENRRHIHHKDDVRPGSFDHYLTYIPCYLEIHTTKKL